MAPPRTHRPLPLIALIASAMLALAAPARAQLSLPWNFEEEVIYHGLNQSVAMALLPDGRLFVIEKASARIRLIVGGALAATDPVLTVPNVDTATLEQGLLGIAVDPGWPARPYIYVHYNHAGSAYIRLSRFTVGGDLGFTANGSLSIDPATRYDILTDIVDNTPYHNGGTLRFGPDGMLYDSIGDDYSPCLAQDLTVLAGKILRLNVAALPAGGGGPPVKSLITPADNPFVAHVNANARLVCHWGMRNPFRFAIDPLTGDMLIGDVGLETREELNCVSAFGRNLQWPIYEGDVPGPMTCGGVDSSSWTDPIYVYDHTQGNAVTAGVIYRPPAGAAIPFPPEYEGDVFCSDTYGAWVRRLKRSGNTWSLAPAPGQPNATDWGLGLGASLIVDWLQAPDGSLYYCRIQSQYTQGPGEIRRIRFRRPPLGEVSIPKPDRAKLEFRAPFPSPSRGGVTFDYALPAERPVSLTIYDVGGRRVRILVELERESAGPHRVTWDGRDVLGRRAAPGPYLARLGVAGQILARRLVLID